MMLKRKVRPSDHDGWSDLVEAPRLDVPDGKTFRRRRFLTNFILTVAIITWFAMALSLINIQLALRNAEPAVTNQALNASRSAATKAMDSWVRSKPVPGIRLLSVDDTVRLSTAKPKTGSQAETSGVDLVSFTLIDRNGVVYRSSVQVVVSVDGLAQVASAPSLNVVPQGGGKADLGQLWPSMIDGSTSEALNKAVLGWAQAYLSGDPASLRLAVGDPDPTHIYQPLPAASGVTVSVAKVAYPSRTSDSAVARVKVKVSWLVGQDDAGQSSASTFDVDVLIQRADTAAPQVVAWGDPGTGPTLKPLSNALTSSVVNGVPTAPATFTPSPTPEIGG